MNTVEVTFKDVVTEEEVKITIKAGEEEGDLDVSIKSSKSPIGKLVDDEAGISLFFLAFLDSLGEMQ
jgi:hypothetical protein